MGARVLRRDRRRQYLDAAGRRKSPYPRPAHHGPGRAIWHERLGRSADEIAAEYDLTLADEYPALTYYLDHRDDIDRRIADDQALARALRERTPSKVSDKLRWLHGEG